VAIGKPDYKLYGLAEEDIGIMEKKKRGDGEI
jgi:hypothetical protein